MAARLTKIGGWTALSYTFVGGVLSVTTLALGGHWGVYASRFMFGIVYSAMSPAYTMVSPSPGATLPFYTFSTTIQPPYGLQRWAILFKHSPLQDSTGRRCHVD